LQFNVPELQPVAKEVEETIIQIMNQASQWSPPITPTTKEVLAGEVAGWWIRAGGEGARSSLTNPLAWIMIKAILKCP
jgi:hypothetical protein